LPSNDFDQIAITTGGESDSNRLGVARAGSDLASGCTVNGVAGFDRGARDIGLGPLERAKIDSDFLIRCKRFTLGSTDVEFVCSGLGDATIATDLDAKVCRDRFARAKRPARCSKFS
jgi:hypothetical protein